MFRFIITLSFPLLPRLCSPASLPIGVATWLSGIQPKVSGSNYPSPTPSSLKIMFHSWSCVSFTVCLLEVATQGSLGGHMETVQGFWIWNRARFLTCICLELHTWVKTKTILWRHYTFRVVFYTVSLFNSSKFPAQEIQLPFEMHFTSLYFISIYLWKLVFKFVFMA